MFQYFDHFLTNFVFCSDSTVLKGKKGQNLVTMQRQQIQVFLNFRTLVSL